MKPPLFVQSVFGILGGIGTHPEDVAHMKRTADRLFGDDYHWSVLGAGRNQLPIAAHGRRDGRQCAGRAWKIRCGSGPDSSAKSNADQVRRARAIIENLGLEIASPDEAREILSLKGGDKVAF